MEFVVFILLALGLSVMEAVARKRREEMGEGEAGQPRESGEGRAGWEEVLESLGVPGPRGRSGPSASSEEAGVAAAERPVSPGPRARRPRRAPSAPSRSERGRDRSKREREARLSPAAGAAEREGKGAGIPELEPTVLGTVAENVRERARRELAEAPRPAYPTSVTVGAVDAERAAAPAGRGGVEETPSAPPASALRALKAGSRGLRAAVILREVLGPPVGMRKGGGGWREPES